MIGVLTGVLFKLFLREALVRFGAGFHPTETPQLFDSVRRNPQEFEIVRTG